MTEARLSFRREAGPDRLVLAVHGEVDVANASDLARAVRAELARATADALVVELDTCHFDAAGISALVSLRAGSTIPVTVRCLRAGTTARILALFGVLDA